MGRLNVTHNGKWACFSTIVDGFITEFVDLRPYVEWRKEQEFGMSPIAPRNTIDLKEAIVNIRRNKSEAEALAELIEIGIPAEEAQNIINQVNEDQYMPKKNEVEGVITYSCPNCHKFVEEGQEECDEDTCSIPFIWLADALS